MARPSKENIEVTENIETVEVKKETSFFKSNKKVYFSIDSKSLVISFDAIDSKGKSTPYRFENPEKNIFSIQEDIFNNLMKGRLFKYSVKKVNVVEL